MTEGRPGLESQGDRPLEPPRTLDKVLVPILVLVWGVFFVLGVKAQVEGGSVALLGLAVDAPDDYPTPNGAFSGVVHGSDPLAGAGLREGDRLIRLGDADLRGVGTLGFLRHVIDQAGQEDQLPVVFERDGERLHTTLTLAPKSFMLPMLVASFTLTASALFLLLRGSQTPTVRAYFYFGMTWELANCASPGSRLELYAWLGVGFVGANWALWPLAFRFLYLFPDDRAPEGRWYRIWPWFLSVATVSTGAFAFSRWMAIGEPVSLRPSRWASWRWPSLPRASSAVRIWSLDAR
jgi:hypothetical protein